jgi:phospholipase/carboxylesterase
MNTADNDPHGNEEIIYRGEKIEVAKAAMILIHGRGADAESILMLTNELNADGFLFAAPQASGNSWYPYSFLSPVEMNEPGISSGLKKIKDLISFLNQNGIEKERIILLGFSQGACLTLEFAARNPAKYGGIIALSGGLIGDKLNENYSGSFEKTKVFLGCSNIDPHIPEERVHKSAEIFLRLDADVLKKIYPNMGHTVNRDELKHINEIIQFLQKN